MAHARPGHKMNQLSKWSKKDSDRLSEFLDRDNTPMACRNLNYRKIVINWKALTRAFFPDKHRQTL